MRLRELINEAEDWLQVPIVHERGGLVMDYLEVAVNPRERDVRKLAQEDPHGEVRIMLASNLKVYAWRASEGTHDDVVKFIGEPKMMGLDQTVLSYANGYLEDDYSDDPHPDRWFKHPVRPLPHRTVW